MKRNFAFLLLSLFSASSISASFTDAIAIPLKEPACIQSWEVAEAIRNEYMSKSFNKHHMMVRHMGPYSVANPVSYDVGVYSGFHVTPLDQAANWQRGEYDVGSSGTTAFQVQCDNAGVMINSWWFDHTNVIGGGPHADYGYEWTPDTEPRPWTTETPDLVLQVNMEVPWIMEWPASNGQRPHAQTGISVYIQDRSDPALGRRIPVVIAIYDSDPNKTGEERVLNDTNNNFISTSMKFGNNFVTLSPYSGTGTFTNATWSGKRFFRAIITRANLLAMITALGGNRFSTSPEDYAINLVSAGGELILSGDSNVTFGYSVSALGVYEFR